MKKIIDVLQEVMEGGFEQAGYDKKFGFVTVSNRPDLCQYQCNGAMAAAKQYKNGTVSNCGKSSRSSKRERYF